MAAGGGHLFVTAGFSLHTGWPRAQPHHTIAHTLADVCCAMTQGNDSGNRGRVPDMTLYASMVSRLWTLDFPSQLPLHHPSVRLPLETGRPREAKSTAPHALLRRQVRRDPVCTRQPPFRGGPLLSGSEAVSPAPSADMGTSKQRL